MNLANLPVRVSVPVNVTVERALVDGSTYSIQNVGNGIIRLFVGGAAAPAVTEGQELTRRGDVATVPVSGGIALWVWAATVDSELGIQDITP